MLNKTTVYLESNNFLIQAQIRLLVEVFNNMKKEHPKKDIIEHLKQQKEYKSKLYRLVHVVFFLIKYLLSIFIFKFKWCLYCRN